MEINKKEEYYRRLTTPLNIKKSEYNMFIDQFLQGKGNELADKFWSDNSSSRLAFDLYSWMAVESKTVVFQFEKQLPGVVCKKSGPSGVPNMDVYFETKDDIVFIESKYTEKESKAFIKGDKPHLSKAYWQEEYGNMSIADRFYGRKDIASYFSNFVENIQKAINNINCPKWFYPKQETTHLFGIIFHLLKGRKNENGKFICDKEYCGNITNINFYNIIWKMRGDDFENRDSLPYLFIKEAKELFVKTFGNSLHFNYEIKVVQDLFDDSVAFHGFNFKKANAFGLNVNLYDQMLQYETDRKR